MNALHGREALVEQACVACGLSFPSLAPITCADTLCLLTEPKGYICGDCWYWAVGELVWVSGDYETEA